MNDLGIGIRFKHGDTVIDLNDVFLNVKVLLDSYVPTAPSNDSLFVTESASVYVDEKDVGITVMNQLLRLFSIVDNDLGEVYFQYRKDKYSEWLESKLVKDSSGVSGICQPDSSLLNNFTRYFKFDVVWNRERYLQTIQDISLPFISGYSNLAGSQVFQSSVPSHDLKTIRNSGGLNFIHLEKGVINGAFPSVPTITIEPKTTSIAVEKLIISNKIGLNREELDIHLEAEDATNGIAVVPSLNSSGGAYATYQTTMGGEYAFVWDIPANQLDRFGGQTFKPFISVINTYELETGQFASFGWVLKNKSTGKIIYKSRLTRVYSDTNYIPTNDITFPLFPLGYEQNLELCLVFIPPALPDAIALDFVLLQPVNGYVEIQNPYGVNLFDNVDKIPLGELIAGVYPSPLVKQLSIVGGVKLHPYLSNTLYFVFLSPNNQFNSLFEANVAITHKPTYLF